MWHFKRKMQILFPLELLSLLSANCRFLKIGLSERWKTPIAQPPKDVRKDLPVSHEKGQKRTACPTTAWTQCGNKVQKTKLPPLAIFKNKNFWVALQQTLKHTRRRPEVNMSKWHGSWLTPSDIIGAFHSPKDHPPLFPLHRFPHHPFLPHQSRSVMWDISPSITLKLVPAFPVLIGHLTCENNFCGAIVCSVVFKQSQRMGRGTHSCHTGRCPRVQNQWFSGDSCLVFLSWLFFTFSRRDIFSDSGSGSKTSSLSWSATVLRMLLCEYTPWHVLTKTAVPSETLQCSEGYSKILLWSCSWGSNLQTGKPNTHWNEMSVA